MRSKEEHLNQVALFDWWKLYAPTKGLDTCVMFAVPNMSPRSPKFGANMKREGMTAGVSDIFLMVPKGPFGACIIEMKSEKGRLTDSQKKFTNAMREQGYSMNICRSFEQAKEAIKNYLWDY